MELLHLLSQMVAAAFTNIHIKIAIISMFIAQVLKMFFYYLQNRKINFKVFVQASGMPSSHASSVIGLSTSIGIVDGWNSVAYAIAVIFSFIVMYDAAGVRNAAGKQARVLNKILEDYKSEKQVHEGRLKELLGHTPLEVFFGFLLGIVVAITLHSLG